MALPHLDLLRVGGELQTRLEALTGQARRLLGGASEHDLRRLVRPAVEFAQHVPALAGALDLSVRKTVVHGVMLVPSVADRSNSGTLSWVTATMGPQRAGPPEVVQRAGQLSVTARRVTPAVRQAKADLAQHVVGKPSLQHLALLAARRHAGAARDELRTALNSRIAAQPTVSAGALSQHPRSAPPPRVLRRERYARTTADLATTTLMWGASSEPLPQPDPRPRCIASLRRLVSAVHRACWNDPGSVGAGVRVPSAPPDKCRSGP